jgi:hypothetical protein
MKEKNDFKDLNFPVWLTKTLLIRVIGIVLSVVAFIVVALLILRQVDGLRKSMLDFFGGSDSASVASTQTILTGLQPLGQLVSISASVAKADIAVIVDTGGVGGLCNHRANHVAQGAVEAGIDFTQIEEDNIAYNESTDTYTITLPPPQITSCRIEYIRQYERDGGNPTCGIDWDNVRLIANYVATEEFTQDTLDGGILERAETETTTLMESFIFSLTGSNVIVQYADAGATIIPASCQPQLPNGWTYDEVTNNWIRP